MKYVASIVESLLMCVVFILCNPMGWVGLLALAFVMRAAKGGL